MLGVAIYGSGSLRSIWVLGWTSSEGKDGVEQR